MISLLEKLWQIILYFGVTISTVLIEPTHYMPETALEVLTITALSTAAEFEKTIRAELPKYDDGLSKRILENEIGLDFFYHEKNYAYTPAVGAFSIPKWIFDYGPEGVCQYVVYCFLGADDTGVGVRAATRLSERKALISDCMKAVQNWIKEKHFPDQWLASYNYEENLEAMTMRTAKNKQAQSEITTDGPFTSAVLVHEEEKGAGLFN